MDQKVVGSSPLGRTMKSPRFRKDIEGFLYSGGLFVSSSRAEALEARWRVSPFETPSASLCGVLQSPDGDFSTGLAKCSGQASG